MKYTRLSIALLLFSIGTVSTVAGEQPNVLLILTDNQSFFELSCHGHADVQTPNIDKLASQSVDFLNFHAPPFCSPSRAELLTGRYALRSGVHDTVGGVSILHRNEATLADYLSEAGYRTAIFGKWHLGLSYPYHPRQRGFHETFIHGGGGIGQLEDYYGNDHIDAIWDHNGTMVPSEGFSSDVLFNRATEFIKSSKDKPFFCFISTPATHTPYQAEPKALEKIKARGVTAEKESTLNLYSMIENIDENVGSILAELDRMGLREDTLVILASDQGVQDRGAPNPRNTDRRPEHNSAFDPKHTVFCMMRYPPFSVAHESRALTGMVDVAPTILDICGLPPIDSMDGRSLRPLLAGQTEWKDDRTLIIHCPRTRYRAKWENASLKTQRWRLVGGDQLYEIAQDRDQLNNVADQYPEVVADLSIKYDRFWDTLPPASDLLSRHLLGAPDAPEVKLNCMDWYIGDHPWGQGNLRSKNANGLWPVEIARDGKYRFELRVYPREAPEPIGGESVSIRVGSIYKLASLAPGADKAVFTLDLKEGQYDLETSFKAAPGSGQWTKRGAFFVYVTYLGAN